MKCKEAGTHTGVTVQPDGAAHSRNEYLRRQRVDQGCSISRSFMKLLYELQTQEYALESKDLVIACNMLLVFGKVVDSTEDGRVPFNIGPD